MLAQFCATLTFERLPREVVHTVKRIILDTIGTTLAAGSLGEGCSELVEWAHASGGPPEATLIGFGGRVPALAAALVNGGLGHALNFDSGGDPGHLGSVLAAPLAAAQQRGAVDGRAFITALAAGLEVMSRLTLLARRNNALNDAVLEGQLFGYFGAGAASGAIFGLDAAEMQSLFGIALMQATGTMQVVYDGDPPAKAVYAAFSNHGGLLAALLARHGLGARIAAFEGRAGLFGLHFAATFDFSELTRQLGEDYQLLNVAFKPWPSSGVTHPFIEAAQALGTYGPDDIDTIRLRGGNASRHWFEPQEIRRRPPTGAAAANSVFYTVARTLERGTVGLAEFTVEAVQRGSPLIDRMVYSLEPELGASAIVEIGTRDGRTLTNRVDSRLGSRTRPISDEKLVQKFEDCARFAPRPVDAGNLVEALQDLENVSDVGALFG